jgi:hypothetical protein
MELSASELKELLKKTQGANKKKAPKKTRHEESRIQKSCVKWFRSQYPKLIIFAIPNGGKRGLVEASIMKAEGVLAGIPDLLLLKPSKGYHGLFIEMKTEKGDINPNQRRMIPIIQEAGYQVIICRSFNDFKQQVESYIHGN